MTNTSEPKYSDTPISVQHSDITPITHQPITPVHGNDWNDMPTSKLHVELNTLRLRQQALLEMGQVQGAKQIQQGISTIEAIIATRYKLTDGLI